MSDIISVEDLEKSAEKLGFRRAKKAELGFGPELDQGGPLTLQPGKGAAVGREIVIVTNAKRGRTASRLRARNPRAAS